MDRCEHRESEMLPTNCGLISAAEGATLIEGRRCRWSGPSECYRFWRALAKELGDGLSVVRTWARNHIECKDMIDRLPYGFPFDRVADILAKYDAAKEGESGV